MLADRFFAEEDARSARGAARQAARLARDAVIAVQFPALDQRFQDIVTTVTGPHAALAVTRQAVVDNFVDRGFATLTRTVTTLRSTLDPDPTTVTCTSDLEARWPDQFGAIRLTSDGVPAPRLARIRSARTLAMLAHGIVMAGTATADLVLPLDGRLEPLVPRDLDALLAALFLGHA